MADDRLEVLLYQAESRAERAEAKLAEVRAMAERWAALEPSAGITATVLREAGRELLKVLGSEEEARDA